jgi:Meiotically Up-regulated Gene 113 (MUG113) protein
MAKLGERRVYFAVSGREVKIGLTKDPTRRFSAMRTVRPDIKLFGHILGDRQTERKLQQRFGANCIAGEWFHLTTELESVINERPAPKHYGCVLGSDGDGTRQPAAQPDHWRGHLVVIALGRYLLDATLDQVNAGHPWLHAEPFVGEVTLEFLRGEKSLLATTGKAGSSVCYSAFPGRGGFKTAPDMRPSHRRDIVNQVLNRCRIGPSESAARDAAKIGGR